MYVTVLLKPVEITPDYKLITQGGLLGCILDRVAQVTFLGLKFGESLLFWVNHLHNLFFGSLSSALLFGYPIWVKVRKLKKADPTNKI